MCNIADSGVASSVIEGVHIHIFVLTGCKNNRESCRARIYEHRPLNDRAGYATDCRIVNTKHGLCSVWKRIVHSSFLNAKWNKHIHLQLFDTFHLFSINTLIDSIADLWTMALQRMNSVWTAFEPYELLWFNNTFYISFATVWSHVGCGHERRRYFTVLI